MSSPAGPTPQPRPRSEDTDPGAGDALESLYRGSGRPGPALRPFETALQPPDGTDGYSWIFRSEPATPPSASSARSAVGGDQPDAVPATSAVRPRRRWLVATLLTAGAVCGALVAAVLRGL